MDIDYSNLFIGLAIWLVSGGFIWLYFYSISKKNSFKLKDSPIKLWIGIIGFFFMGSIFVFGAFGIDIVRSLGF